jgi:hypothetical protein
MSSKAFRVPVEISGTEGSDLVDASFAETMADLLTLHHALHEAPLSKKPFEYVLKQCLIAQGHPAVLNPAPGGSSYDVEGGGIRWSLKTEAAKGSRRNYVAVGRLVAPVMV